MIFNFRFFTSSSTFIRQRRQKRRGSIYNR